MRPSFLLVCAIGLAAAAAAAAWLAGSSSHSLRGSAATPPRSPVAAVHRVAARLAAHRPDGAAGAWQLRFDDEFNGSRLDLTRWQPNWYGTRPAAATAPPDPGDIDCVDPAQANQRGGLLILGAVARPCRVGGRAYPYTAGLVQTRHTFTFSYGFVEARIRVPATRAGRLADFPGWWASGTGPWPNTGEIDVMETTRQCGPGLGYYFTSLRVSHGGCMRTAHPAGWHVFGADWEPGRVRFYLDGRRVGTVSRGVTGRPMFLVLDDSVNPREGAPSAPSRLLVDYVRVWGH